MAYSANQAVAHNLRVARSLRGWTQEQAAKQLERYLGDRWSKASWSVAERSVDGKRVKQFSADEIVAFSRAFDLPVSFFFLPIGGTEEETPRVVRAPQGLPRQQRLNDETLLAKHVDNTGQFLLHFVGLLDAMPEEARVHFDVATLAVAQRVAIMEAAVRWREVQSDLRTLALSLASLLEVAAVDDEEKEKS